MKPEAANPETNPARPEPAHAEPKRQVVRIAVGQAIGCATASARSRNTP